MRQVQIWLIVHPDEERTYVQTKPVTQHRTDALRKQGYDIYTCVAQLPWAFGADTMTADVSDPKKVEE